MPPNRWGMKTVGQRRVTYLLYDGLVWYTQYEECLTEARGNPATVATARQTGSSIEAVCVQSVNSHWPEGAPILPPRPQIR